MRHMTGKKALLGIALLLFAITWAQEDLGESRAVQFDVWPPGATVHYFKEGASKPLKELGKSNETFELSRSQFFPEGAQEALFIFKAPGYDDGELYVDWNKLDSLKSTNGVYPKSVELVPATLWAKVGDQVRRNKFAIIFVLTVVGVAGWVFAQNSGAKRFKKLHREFGGDGNVTEFAEYILFRTLGQGASGKVSVCCRKEEFYGLPKAGKVTPPDFGVLKQVLTNFQSRRPEEGSEFEDRFKREVGALDACCGHKSIVGLRDYGIDPDTNIAYIVMDRAKGESLGAYIDRSEKNSIEDVKEIARQLCEGLQHMHDQGVVHRDIKPQNIVVDEDNTLKIVDLGIAKTKEEQDQLTKEGTVGTLLYQPIWQLHMSEPHPSFDQYAAAVCIAELLKSEQPFYLPEKYDTDDESRRGLKWIMHKEYAPITQKRPDLPESLDKFFKSYFKAMMADDVYPSMNEFFAAFEESISQTKA